MKMKTAMSTWLSNLPRREDPRPPQAARPLEERRRVEAARAGVLTPRELDVLRLLAADCTYAQAANRLGVSPHTVVTHIKNAYRKLEVHSAAAAVMRAVELGLPLRESALP
jgi:DNA-binding CsgD family transcriptional regulator